PASLKPVRPTELLEMEFGGCEDVARERNTAFGLRIDAPREVGLRISLHNDRVFALRQLRAGGKEFRGARRPARGALKTGAATIRGRDHCILGTQHSVVYHYNYDAVIALRLGSTREARAAHACLPRCHRRCVR